MSEEGGKVRNRTMQVDVDELYAALEERGLAVPDSAAERATAPPPLPPGGSVAPEAPAAESGGRGKLYLIALLVAVVSAVLAWTLVSVVFGEEAPADEQGGGIQIGEIEVE